MGKFSEQRQSTTNMVTSTWVTNATTKEECVSKAPVCFEMLSSGVLSQRPRTGSQFPINYSFKSQSECVACGGVYGNYYSWKSSYYWAPRTFEPFQWRQRQMTAGNYWLRAPDTQYFSDIVQAAIGQRFAKILASEMLCRYVSHLALHDSSNGPSATIKSNRLCKDSCVTAPTRATPTATTACRPLCWHVTPSVPVCRIRSA